MTDRLYYTDPYSREFDATVEQVDLQNGRALVRLDRTVFYPTTGGQPFDTGMLGGHRVVDVVEDAVGDVVHVVDVTGRPGPSALADAPDRRSLGGGWLDPANITSGPGPLDPALCEAGPKGPALQPGERVHGAIDWARRFDHMQQHTGQHILSAAFDRIFQVRTVSFHLGADASTIDLSRETTPRELAAAEGEANRILWENRPVSIRFVSAEDAAALPLRKGLGGQAGQVGQAGQAGSGPRKPARRATLRLIDVDGFDLSACGGTHVARTGEIGIIAVTAWERFKGGQRLAFQCGHRALAAFGSLRDTAAAGARLLSVPVNEQPAAIERLQAEEKEQRRVLAALQADLASYRAEELAAAAETTARGRLALGAVDADANTLKALAAAIVSRKGFVAVLVSTSRPSLAVVARSADVDVAAHAVLGRLIATFGGKGGGKPDLAQGGGLDAAADAILAEARAAVSA